MEINDCGAILCSPEKHESNSNCVNGSINYLPHPYDHVKNSVQCMDSHSGRRKILHYQYHSFIKDELKLAQTETS